MEEQSNINKEGLERDKEGVKRDRHSKSSGSTPPSPTYEGKDLHGRNIEI